MNSTNDYPDEKNEAQEESEAIEQEHEVDATDMSSQWSARFIGVIIPLQFAAYEL